MLSVTVSLNVQSSLEGEVERCDGELTGFVSLCKEILQRFVRDHFPTTSTTPANQVRIVLTLDVRYMWLLPHS